MLTTPHTVSMHLTLPSWSGFEHAAHDLLVQPMELLTGMGQLLTSGMQHLHTQGMELLYHTQWPAWSWSWDGNDPLWPGSGLDQEGIDSGSVIYQTDIQTTETTTPLTFTLAGDDAALFDIDASSGMVTWSGAETFGSDNQYTFTITGSDGLTSTIQEVQLDVSGPQIITTVTQRLTDDAHDLTLTSPGNLHATGNDLDNTLTGNAQDNTLQGGAGDDTLKGEAGHDTLQGDAGNDTLYGGAGNDLLDGGTGTDLLEGGSGNDRYIVADRADTITERGRSGIDRVESALSWTLGANLEDLTLTTTADLDGTGNGLANTLTGNSGANLLHGGDGHDTVRGGAGNDTLFGDAGQDFLFGEDGNDRLAGGVGMDRMAGGRGDDLYIVEEADDLVIETANAGNDQVESAISWQLGPNLENLTLTGTGTIDATGNRLANALTGNSAANTLDGGDGGDTLQGGDGDDTLKGGAGPDVLQGGAGADTLSGGRGQDRLTGGAGADAFKFILRSEGGDVITDFQADQGDRLLFVSQNFGALATGQLDASRLAIGTTDGATTPAQRFIFNTTSGLLRYDPDGNGALAGVTVATLNPLSTLSANQIQIVAG
ncbi:MAG: calcium-binding protein [Magnetococcales bacterium]|nr:calcium-binding protein [Magnetococcales bacterium]